MPSGKALRRGDRGERVAALRERLRATGDLDAPKDAEPVYDDEVAGAVARFQVRHGLAPDSGIVAAATLSALNVPVETRIRQIELNLDRYRWLPAEFEKRYLLVNIPDFHLRAYDDGKEVFEQRVIVGDEYQNATPVFADSMTYLVFRPEWNVPSSILVNEMLPKLREDIYDLASRGFEVVDTQGDSVVQRPVVHRLGRRGQRRAHVPGAAALGREQLAGPGEVHVPEPVQHLSPRHAVAKAVRPAGAHAEPRVRPGGGPGAARRLRARRTRRAGTRGRSARRWRTRRRSVAAWSRSSGRCRCTSSISRPSCGTASCTSATTPTARIAGQCARLGKPSLDEPTICEELDRLLGG